MNNNLLKIDSHSPKIVFDKAWGLIRQEMWDAPFKDKYVVEVMIPSTVVLMVRYYCKKHGIKCSFNKSSNSYHYGKIYYNPEVF